MNKNPCQIKNTLQSNKTEENPLQNKRKLCKKKQNKTLCTKKTMQKTQTQPLVKNILQNKTKHLANKSKPLAIIKTLRKKKKHYCESCALPCVSLGSCTSLGSVLMLALRVRPRCVVLVELLGPPTASWPKSARVYCGCKPGPTRVALHPGRMVEEPERQPYVRWTTCYDFKETWIIDVYSCTPPRPVRVHDLVDPGSTSTSDC